MAYNGYLLKIGDYVFPQTKIKASSYSAYVNMQDYDPITDADGYLHRDTVDLKALKVEFETIPMLTNVQFAEIMRNLRANMIQAKGRIVEIEAYIPEYDDYVTQTGYMVDIKPQMYGTYGGQIHYNSIRFAFVGGIADDY